VADHFESQRVGRLHTRAVARNAAGQPSRGAALIASALNLLNVDPQDEPPPVSAPEAGTGRAVTVARLLATLAKSEVEVRGADRGLATLDRAWRWALIDGDDHLLAFLHGQRGLILFRSGRFAEALTEFDSAARWFDRVPGIDKCRVLINRGALYVEMGDLRAARADLTLCVDLARQLGLNLVERIAVHNLGCLEFIAGDLPLALRTMDEGMSLGGETQPGIALLDRARVLLAAGLQHEADDTLAAAAVQLTKDRCWQDVGEVELARAESALLAGDPRAARRLAARARDRFRRHGNSRWRRNAELVLLQADLTAGRPAGRLVPSALRLAEEFRDDGFVLQARVALLLAAENMQRMGQLPEAIRLAGEAGSSRVSDPIAVRLQTRLVRARLDLAAGRTATARRQLRSGLTELAAYRAHFGSIDLQTASAVHGIRLAELEVELALRGGRARSVLAAVERSRAVSGRLVSVRPPRDEVAADLLAELRQAVESMRAKEADRRATAEVAERRKRAAELQRELRARAWLTGGTCQALQPASHAEICDRLKAEATVLVCYVETNGALHAVVDDGDSAAIRPLGSAAEATESLRRVRADLDVLANGHLPGGLMTAVRGSLIRSLEHLDGSLVRPLRLPGRRLLIVPTGPLAALPWGSLPSLAGCPVVVAPSATAWLSASASSGRRHASVAAFAGPDLRRATEEVRAIGQSWPDASVFTDMVARQDTLVTAMTSSTVVHIAAHGQHQAENPLFSSIRLADGPMFAYELDQTARTAEHVVLSACELGRATIRPGDEALGLTSVLLHLGTRSVVSGVARVHDDVAAQVMTRYHRLLSSGRDSAEALADASEAEDKVVAPFVCFGSGWAMAS